MHLEDLTPEQQEKLVGCEKPEDVLDLVRQEGYELSDDELDEITGGWDFYDSVQGKVREALQCAYCGSYEVYRFPQPGVAGVVNCRCKACGAAYTVIGGVLHT